MEETTDLSFEKLYFRTFEVGDGVSPMPGRAALRSKMRYFSSRTVHVGRAGLAVCSKYTILVLGSYCEDTPEGRLANDSELKCQYTRSKYHTSGFTGRRGDRYLYWATTV